MFHTLLRRAGRRPLIVLTGIYVVTLVFLDMSGFFRASPGHIAARREAVVEGTVTDTPEDRNSRTTFILDAFAIDGRQRRARLLATSYDAIRIAAGDVVRIQGTVKIPPSIRNEGGFDYRTYLQRQNIHYLLYCRNCERTGRRNISPLRRCALFLRNDIIRTIKEQLPPQEAAVLIPMLVGDKSGLTPELAQAFSTAGAMHVLVVSGMNVAYCTAIFLFLFRLTGLRRRRAALLTIPFIILYIFMTGATPPVVRAGVMALSVIVALSLAREPLIAQSLSLAALVILIADPQALFTASFQLSFAATIGIVVLYPPLLRPFSPLPLWCRRTAGATVAVTLAAQLAVLPLIAYYFNRISLIGLFSNILIIPLTALITGGGMALYVLHLLVPALTHPIALLNYYLVHTLLALVTFFSSVSWASIHIPTPPLSVLAAYYLALFGTGLTEGWRQRIALSALALLLAALPTISSLRARDELRITFLDVGNSDAIHIRFPGGVHWLIDTGGSYSAAFDPAGKILCPYLWSNGIRRIDRVVLTHPHTPHYGGLPAIAPHFEIGEIVSTRETGDTPLVKEVCGQKNIRWKEARAGDRFIVGKSTVTLLSPQRAFENADDNCLICSIEYCGRNVLLTSDMGEDAEKALLAAHPDLTATVLQLPDHGQRAVAETFLDRVAPQIIVVSTGRKSNAIAGLPHGSTTASTTTVQSAGSWKKPCNRKA